MANKVASKRWIYSNFSVGSSSNECATKTEILGFGLYITNDSSYASNQLVREEDIYLPAWTYSFSVSDWDKNVGESGGTTSSISISSTKSRLGTTESVGWSIDSSTVPSWVTWNSSDMTFTVASNSSTSSRTADIYFEQDESGKRDYARVTQSGHTQVVSYNYIFWTSASGGTTASGSFGQSGSSIQPEIYSYRETVVDGTVTSRDAVSFSYTDIPSWITGNAVSTGYNPPNSPTYYAKMTASENTSVDARAHDVVITQSGSDKEITISVSQPGKANDTYVFTISPSTYDITYSGGTFIPRTTSTKNGSNIGYSLTSGGTDWVVVDISGKISIEILKNTSTSSRSATLVFTQNESGLKCYVYINQSGYTPTYTFNVSPTNLSVTAAETNETLTVNSYKTVLKSDGSETTESLDYEFSSDTSWVNAARTTTNTTYITIAENLTVAKRNAKITLTQAESGAQAFTNVTQAGKVQSSNKLTITSITYDGAYLFSPGVTPVVGPTMYLKFLIPTTFTWETSSGLTMNRGTAYAGDTCNIYVFENSRYRLVRSFTLQTGEQTIAI
nr:MAG TPA: cellulase [Caudoviricetes sp.]